jgi:trehalose-phosphatase
MLDHDGTLAPFDIARSRAFPAPVTLTLLQRIAASEATTLVVISGRPVRELAELLGHPDWTLVGEHGWEVRDPGEPVVRHASPPGSEAWLDHAERLARDAGLGERLERKRTSLALHTRGVERVRAREEEAAAARLWAPLAETAPIGLVPFHGGLELRVRGRDKGTAVRELLARDRLGTLGVHVGDDLTDEDAFTALAPTGLGVRVGPTEVPSAASDRLAGPEEVAAFLAQWLEVTERDARARA